MQNEFGQQTLSQERNLDEAVEKLKSGGKFVKFERDKGYVITLKDFGTGIFEKPDKFSKITGAMKTVEQFTVDIVGGGYTEVNGKDLIWEMTAYGEQSLYGMVMSVCKHNKKTKGTVLHIKVLHDNKDRKYVVEEYNNIKTDSIQFPDQKKA